MLRDFGLAVCLCCMAMGLNNVLADQSAALQQKLPKRSAQNVTNGSTELVRSNQEGNAVLHPAHIVSGKGPPDTSAQCRDGGFGRSHLGTCSSNGDASR